MVRKKIVKYSLFATVVLAVLILVLYGSLEITSRPDFCSSCHYMEPYVEGWKTSSHADVTCTKCHFPPGFKSKIKGKMTAASMVVNYMTGIYKRSKPWAEISDESCLRSGCHVERLLDGQVEFKEGILFDHKPHLSNLRRGKKLRCTSCHSQIVQGEHISVTESTCFLCHFKNQPMEARIDNCNWCHGAPELDGSDGKQDHSFVLEHEIDCRKCHGEMQVGDGAVPIERCSQCHAEIDHIEKYQDVDFIHTLHVTDSKVECQVCHSIIQHKSVAKSSDIFPECQTCHIATHQAQLDLFSGIGGRQVPDHPNPMFTGGLNCEACHVYHELNYSLNEFGHDVGADAESCESCHGKGYGKILDQWKLVMDKKTNLLEEIMGNTKVEIDNFHGDEKIKTESKNLLSDAIYNFNLVKKAKIVHNVAYSDELISSAMHNVRQALDIIDSDRELPDISIYSTLVPSECKNCHYGMEEISVVAFGIQFSHDIHIIDQKLPCSKCHSNIKEHGETIISKNDCLSCHHTQEAVTCEQCHGLQASIYSGEIEFARDEADIMYEAEITCQDCHHDDESEVVRNNVEACEACHDEDYAEILAGWQEDTQNLLDQVGEKLNRPRSAGNAELNIGHIRQVFEKIQADNSRGAHNIEAITRILEEMDGELSQQ